MEIKSIPEIIKTVSQLMEEKNYDEAYEFARTNVDLEKEYLEGEYVFKNLLEELLFQILVKKEVKKKYPIMLDYSDLYSNYGEILIHFNEIEDAEKSFNLSHKYNPINVKAKFGLSEVARHNDDLDEFHRLTIESFKIAYYPQDLAKSFRNLSYYFLKIAESEDMDENLKIAICLKKIGEDFDNESDIAKKESEDLNGLINKFDSDSVSSISDWSLDESKDFIKSKGLPYKAGIEIMTICKNLGFQLDEAKKVVPALFYFNIAYDLSKDESIKITIDDLNEKIERRRNE